MVKDDSRLNKDHDEPTLIEHLSLIIPVLNEKELIGGAIRSLLSQQYPNGKLEIVVVDDGSTDGTLEVLQGFGDQIRLVSLEENRGRAFARLTGAEKATYQSIIFFDARLFVEKDFVEQMSKGPFDVSMVGHVKMRYPSWFGNVMDMLRTYAYRSFYKNLEASAEFFEITNDNFNKTPKGTTCVFFRDKEDLIKACKDFDVEDRSVSEDTRLFRNVLNRGKTLARNLKATCYYSQRQGFLKNFRHLFERGPRFVDYYYRFHPTYRTILNLATVIALASILMLVTLPSTWKLILATAILADFLFAAVLSRKITEFFQAILILPFVLTSFGLGLARGLFNYWIRSISRSNVT